MTIIVVSLRNGTFKAPQDFTQIYIGRKSSAYTGLPGGRPLGSPLGNPFYVPYGCSQVERERVIALYKEWLLERLENPDSQAAKEFYRIKSLHESGTHIALACWCKPKSCHGDVLKELLLK